VETPAGLECVGDMAGELGVKRFVEGEDHRQGILLPEYLDEYVGDDNPVRVVEVFAAELDLGAPGFAGVVPEVTGRPACHPSTRHC
jgi:transposase